MACLAASHVVRINLRAAHTPIISRRALHLSPIVQKKKGKVVIEDLFSDNTVAEELIKPALDKRNATFAKAVAPVPSSSKTLGGADAPSRSTGKKKLSPEMRLERFDQIVNFVTPRLGRRPAVKVPEVRKSAWVHLVGLAATEEQLEKVTNMFPGWKESGHQFDPQFSELFIRRCEELSCPLLALNVFGNFSKYNLNLTLPGARQLMHSLHVEHPIDTVMTLSALHSVYRLPPVAQDLASCSMLISACFKHNSKDSLKVANALLPHLEAKLKTTGPRKVSQNPTKKALDKPRVWVKWALKKVDKALYVKNGERVDWLTVWRTRSRHIPELSQS